MRSSGKHILAVAVLCVGAEFFLNAGARSASAGDAPPGFPLRRATPSRKAIWRFGDDGQQIVVEGQSYTPAEAIPILVSILTDPQRDVGERERAGDTLMKLMWRPEAKAYVPALLGAYFEEQNQLIKAGILLSLVTSGDARVLGFFEHLVRTEDAPGIRLLAAYGLAEWNVRSGVAELVRLIRSKARLGARSVGEEALIFLEQLNRDQGWGVPVEQIRSQALEVRKASQDQAGFEPVHEARARWFERNRDRFPVVPETLRESWRRLAASRPNRAVVSARSTDVVHAVESQAVPAFIPDERIQDLLHEFRRAAETWDRNGCRACDILHQLQSLGPERLVPQLAYMAAHGPDKREQLFCVALTRMVGLTPSQVVDALVPYLDADDPALEQVAREWLKEEECLSSANPQPCFEAYEHLFRSTSAQGVPGPLALARYLYRRAPGAAMLLFARLELRQGRLPDADRANPRRPLLWAEHVISDTIWKQENGFLDQDKVEPEAARELEKLATRKEWWARLYVAEIMRQHPAFRRPALIRHLARDDHPLVRESIEAILAQDKKPARP